MITGSGTEQNTDEKVLFFDDTWYGKTKKVEGFVLQFTERSSDVIKWSEATSLVRIEA